MTVRFYPLGSGTTRHRCGMPRSIYSRVALSFGPIPALTNVFCGAHALVFEYFWPNVW